MEERGELQLPADFSAVIPSSVIAWLLKAGVSSKLSEEYHIGWSAQLGRIVIPVWDEEELVAVQSRAVYEGQKPKYINKKGGPVKSPVFVSKDELMLEDFAPKCRVITEDILSSIRVGRFVRSWSTLGTNLSDRVATRANTSYIERVLIWYDGDAAGIKGARRAHKILELLGVEHEIIKTEKDPKEYSNAEIKRILADYCVY